MHNRLLLCAASLFLCVASLRANVAYNLVNDFSAITNPNGVWTFGSSTISNGVLGNFVPYTLQDTTTNPGVWDYWLSGPLSQGYPYYNDTPFLAYNASGVPQDLGASTDLMPTDVVQLMPGYPPHFPQQNADSDVRFTAPVTGLYTFTGEFHGPSYIGYEWWAFVYAYKNLTVAEIPLTDIGWYSDQRDPRTVPISFDENLQAGEFLDFGVQTGNFWGNETYLKLNVTQVSPASNVPEPSTIVLALVPAFFLTLRLRRNPERGVRK